MPEVPTGLDESTGDSPADTGVRYSHHRGGLANLHSQTTGKDGLGFRFHSIEKNIYIMGLIKLSWAENDRLQPGGLRLFLESCKCWLGRGSRIMGGESAQLSAIQRTTLSDAVGDDDGKAPLKFNSDLVAVGCLDEDVAAGGLS